MEQTTPAVRLSGSWMSIWDERILEVLRNEGPKTPTKISKLDHIHVSQPHVSDRLSRLRENNFVKSLGNGVYKITDNGKLYLDGKYDAESHVNIAES